MAGQLTRVAWWENIDEALRAASEEWRLRMKAMLTSDGRHMG